MSNYEKAAKALGITVEQLNRKVARFVVGEMVDYHLARAKSRQNAIQGKGKTKLS